MDKKKLFQLGRDYLLSFPEINEEILNKQLRFPLENRPKSKIQLFKVLIEHAQNRQGMPNSIGKIENYSSTLCGFSPDELLNNFRSWEELFDAIKKNHTPPGRMEKENPHNYWVIFCKAIISIAGYLERFHSIQAFDEYVSRFITDQPDTRLALPLILSEELFGIKFALACDFIKENISPEFIKPDVHIRDIFTGVGVSRSGASDFQIFRDVVAYAQEINEVPYTVDKLFWLIGSGKFYLSYIEVKTNKKHFIEEANSLLGK